MTAKIYNQVKKANHKRELRTDMLYCVKKIFKIVIILAIGFFLGRQSTSASFDMNATQKIMDRAVSDGVFQGCIITGAGVEKGAINIYYECIDTNMYKMAILTDLNTRAVTKIGERFYQK